jgi:uncharacterized RDD family membrane protein YckC
MKVAFRSLFASAAVVWLSLLAFDGLAQQPEPTPQPQPAEEAVEPVEQAVEADERRSVTVEREVRTQFRRNSDDVIVHFGQDVRLGEDDAVGAIVSIFGSTTVAGEVHDTVVSIFGNTRVTGPVGEAAVAIFGDTYVNSTVGDAAVVVFGNLELGPQAEIDGDIVAVGGTIIRDPQAVVHGGSREIVVGEGIGGFEWLRTYVNKCVLYARLLAFESGLGWAWAIAFGFLAFYIVLALMFSGAVEKCVETIEAQPGQTVIASFMTVVLVPVLMLLLVISVIGIAIMPFVGIALLCAALFGKAVILAALGRRVTRFTGIGPFSHIAFAVFVGGLIALALYVIPVVGLIAYKLLGLLGLGVVAYTVLLWARQRRGNGATLAAAPAGAAMPFADPGVAPIDAAMRPAGEPAGDTTAQPSSAPLAAVTMPRAGFWIRMGALFIDCVLIGVVIGILDPPDQFWLLGLAGYGALMWKLKGTTIGGIVCGIRVVRRDGAPLNWDTAIVRALGCFLSFVVAGLGFLWIVFDPERQAWHDKIAGTLVVRPPKGESLV